MGAEPTYHWIRPHQGIERALIPGSSDVVTGNATEDTLKQWIDAVNARGIEVKNWKAEFQDCACKALPQDLRTYACAIVTDNAPEIIKQRRIIGLSDIMGFFSKVKNWWLSGEFAPQEEANRRAAICAMCPLQTQASLQGCSSCSGIITQIANGITEIIGNRSTTSDMKLEHCQICGCSNKITVHMPESVLQKDQQHSGEWPEWCWRRA